ncbi:hypothetical protein [Bradyrhizobium sp. B120]|uniref:hypothetical protein n=1 Tax=Bradyrhizobium sp. B120 TaxID=3410088 RepID=UPI003B97D349
MHACGHDRHGSIVQGTTAFAFHLLRANFAGKVRMFFQPAKGRSRSASALYKRGQAAGRLRPDRRFPRQSGHSRRHFRQRGAEGSLARNAGR